MIPIIVISSQTKEVELFITNLVEKQQFAPEHVFSIWPLKKEIVLSQVKGLVKNLAFSTKTPKLIIFHKFDTAGNEAQNSLLKALEETTGNCQFILVAENEHLLLPTIRSRARIIKLSQKKTVLDQSSNIETLIHSVESAKNFSFLNSPFSKSSDKESVVNLFDKLLHYSKSRLRTDVRYIQVVKEIFKIRALLLTNNLNPQLASDKLLIFIYKLFRMKI